MGKSHRGKRKGRRPVPTLDVRIGDNETKVTEPKTEASQRSPRGRLWFFRAAAILFPFLLLGLLEVILRVVDYGYPTRFFVESQDGGAYTSNLRFGWRFFPRALAREPVLIRTPKDKPDDVYRIFVLGGSAAQGVPDPAFSFGRILEVMLSEAFPDMEIEVEIINTAMTAINSHVVLPIARDIARLEPDLLVVYMGNNEIVGPYGAGSIFRGFAPNLSMVRASVALSGTRVGQFAQSLLGKLDAAETSSWRGLEMFAGHRIAFGEARLETMVEHFSDNLKRISQAGTDAGATVALCTVGVNLKDSAPFASEHRAGLSEADLKTWEETYKAGVKLESEGNCAEAMERYRRAAGIDDLYAELHFRMGGCHLALEERDKALKAFVRARDLDVLRFRADSKLNQTVRQVAKELEDQGVFLVDAEKALGEAAHVPGLPGENLFYEHVHLTFEGNYALAQSVFRHIRERLPFSSGSIQKVPEIDRCAEKLVLTAWNRQSMLESILNMIRHEPFKSRLHHEENVARLEKEMEDLVREETPERASETKLRYEQAIGERGDDVLLRHSAARIFTTLRDYPAAERHYRAALERFPDVPDLLFGLAVAVRAQDRTEEARRLFDQAVELASTPAEMCGRIARNHHTNDRLDEALYWAERTLEIRPEQPDGLSIAGTVHFRRGEYQRAIPFLKSLLRVANELSNRDRADAHCHLAVALSHSGLHDEAMRNLREAIAIDPVFVTPRLLLAQALSGFDQHEEAADQYRAVLRIEPDHSQAQLGYIRLLARQKGCRAAIEQSNEALQVLPDRPEILNISAVHLATCEDQKARNPGLAVERAGQAAERTGYGNPEILNTWAVAQAEDGRFDRAVQILDRALELATATDDSAELVTQLRQQRKMFLEHRRLTEILR